MRRVNLSSSPGSRAALAAALACLLLAGCQGDSTPAETPTGTPTPPPVLTATPAPGDLSKVNPITDPLWKSANWQDLSPPLNDTRTTPPTRIACQWSAQYLYIAFVCIDPEIYQGGEKLWDNDCVEVWLDTSAAGNGTEYFEVVATPQNKLYTCWFRAGEPPTPKADGSPDFAHPASRIPDWTPKGLTLATGQGYLADQSAWYSVLSIPLNTLPAPLRTRGVPQARWKLNLVRYDFPLVAGRRELRQANLSPIFLASPQVSPYRMAELILGPQR